MKKSVVKVKKRENLFTRNYFFVFSILILLLGVTAFADNLFFDVAQPSNSQPKFIIHGIIMFIWYGILVIQTNRIRKLNYQAHIRLGIFGFIVAGLVILSIAYLYYIDDAQPWDSLPFFGKANHIFFPVFVVLILSAYYKRNAPEWHKHAIIVSILLLLEPLLGRAGGNMGIDPVLFATGIWLMLWLSLFAYDIVRLRRLHVLTYVGLIFWLGVYTVVS